MKSVAKETEVKPRMIGKRQNLLDAKNPAGDPMKKLNKLVTKGKILTRKKNIYLFTIHFFLNELFNFYLCLVDIWLCTGDKEGDEEASDEEALPYEEEDEEDEDLDYVQVRHFRNSTLLKIIRSLFHHFEVLKSTLTLLQNYYDDEDGAFDDDVDEGPCF